MSLQSRSGSDSFLCWRTQCMQTGPIARFVNSLHRFFSSVSHLEKKPRDVLTSLCDASRLPRWLVWCYVLSARQEMTRSQDLSFLGPQKRRICSLRNTQRVRVVLVAQRIPGSKNPQPLRADKALMPDLSSLLGVLGGAVLAIYLVRYYREHYTRAGWLRSGQEASHRLHRA